MRKTLSLNRLVEQDFMGPLLCESWNLTCWPFLGSDLFGPSWAATILLIVRHQYALHEGYEDIYKNTYNEKYK